MSSRFSHSSSLTKLVIIIEFMLVAYLMYSLTKNVYNSYTLDKYIEAFQNENAELERDNQSKNDDYLYFTSPEYADKIAKQSLGLVNPGEEVIVLSSDVFSADSATASDEEDVQLTHYDEMSKPKQWWYFFFGD